MMYRIGLGYDVHQLTRGRKLILAGVEIPHELGLHGHSDADVGYHAICDSILGSLSMRDIGYYFNNNNDKLKNVNSKIFLLFQVF